MAIAITAKRGYLHTFQNSALAYTLTFFITTTLYYIFWGGIVAVLTTIEKRYSFASWQSGLIIGAVEIGRGVVLLPLSYFGAKSHVPRITAISTLLCCLTMILIISPHFLLEHTGFTNYNSTTTNNGSISDELCSFTPRTNKSAAALQLALDRDTQQAHVSDTAFSIFVVAMCILGAVASPLTTISLTYIDINASSNKAPLYIGLASSAISFGPMIGAFIGAWAVTIYVDLSYPAITTVHPEWVGAWWIIMVAVAIGGSISAPFLFCFPKRMERKGDQSVSEDFEHELKEMNGEAVEHVKHVVEHGAMVNTVCKIRSAIMGLLKALWRLISNPIYTLLTITRLPLEHCLWGYFFFMPKYMEVIYSMESWQANIIGGITIMCIGIAMIAAGSIITGLKLSYRRTVQMMVGLLGVAIVILVILFFVTCPDVQYNDQDTIRACSGGCHCGELGISPVCDVTNQVSYLSACHAGCMVANGNTSIDASHSNCNCTASGVVTMGVCGQCDTMPVYIVLILLWFSALGMILSPLVPVTIRSVDEEDRGLAMGVNMISTALLAWSVSTTEYGIVIDQTCDKWQMLGDQTGYCQIYHRSKFLYYMNALTLGLLILETLLMSVTLLLVIRYKMTWESKSSKKVPM